MTNEEHRIHARLVDVGVNIILNTALDASMSGRVKTRCVFTGRESTLSCEKLMLVTARQAVDSLCKPLIALIFTELATVRPPELSRMPFIPDTNLPESLESMAERNTCLDGSAF